MAGEQAESDKIQQIVALLKSDGVDAGRSEAQRIVKEAEERAQAIVRQAEEDAKRLVAEARQEASRQLASAEANVRMAISQGLNQFKQAIEKSVLEQALLDKVKEELGSETVKNAVMVLVEAFARSGFSSNDLQVILNEEQGKALKSSLLKELAAKLPADGKLAVQAGGIPGGFLIRSVSGNFSLEVTPQTLQEVLLSYIRSDFRKLFFQRKQ